MNRILAITTVSIVFLTQAFGFSFDADEFVKGLGGWKKGGEFAEYKWPWSLYRTHRPEVTRLEDGGLYIRIRIEHVREPAANDEALLELVYDKRGWPSAAQVTMALKGHPKTTTGVVTRPAMTNKNMIYILHGIELLSWSSLGEPLKEFVDGIYEDTDLQTQVQNQGRTSFPLAIHHNVGLVSLAIKERPILTTDVVKEALSDVPNTNPFDKTPLADRNTANRAAKESGEEHEYQGGSGSPTGFQLGKQDAIAKFGSEEVEIEVFPSIADEAGQTDLLYKFTKGGVQRFYNGDGEFLGLHEEGVQDKWEDLLWVMPGGAGVKITKAGAGALVKASGAVAKPARAAAGGTFKLLKSGVSKVSGLAKKLAGGGGHKAARELEEHAAKAPIWTSTKSTTAVENAFEHWKKHGAEFPEFQNAKQYVEGAKDFFNNPPAGTLVKTRPNGERVFYNPANNTFGVQAADGAPKTMFRPDPVKHGHPSNLDYFNAQ